MAASAVRVDRPAEGEQRRLGDLVDDAARVDVEELHAAELAPADVALDLLLEEGALTLIVLRQLPAHGASIANIRSVLYWRTEPVVPGRTGWTSRPEQPFSLVASLTECVSPGGVTSSAAYCGHVGAESCGTLVPSTRAEAVSPGASSTVGGV